jgi:phosphoribosylformylglycinamidine synthase subunit PurSL
MVSRLEIALKKRCRMPKAHGIAQEKPAITLDWSGAVRVIRVLALDADLDQDQLETARTHIFTNPVTEESSFAPMARDFDWLVWIGFRPGVRDTAGSTAAEAIQDLLKTRLRPGEASLHSKLYAVTGRMSRAEAQTLASGILANDIIQQWKVFGPEEWDPDAGIGYPIPKVILNHEPRVTTIAIGSDWELKRISEERNLALQESDIPVIRRYFLRKDSWQTGYPNGLSLPTDVELEYISQSRSDHCNHNTFRGLFRYHRSFERPQGSGQQPFQDLHRSTDPGRSRIKRNGSFPCSGTTQGSPDSTTAITTS